MSGSDRQPPRLSDIKKRLGIKDRDDIYGVFKYKSKSLAAGNRLSLPLEEGASLDMSSEEVKPIAKPRRRPPPPKPAPYQPKQALSVATVTTVSGATSGDTPPLQPISPNTLRRIDQRPRLNTPKNIKPLAPRPSQSPSPLSTPSPSPRSLSPQPYFPSDEIESSTVTLTNEPIINESTYCEVSSKTLLKSLPDEEEDHQYDVTSHIDVVPPIHPSAAEDYSSLNSSTANDHQTTLTTFKTPPPLKPRPPPSPSTSPKVSPVVPRRKPPIPQKPAAIATRQPLPPKEQPSPTREPSRRVPSPPHRAPSPSHRVPSPSHRVPSPSHRVPSPHRKPSPPHRKPYVEPSPPHREPSPPHRVPSPPTLPHRPEPTPSLSPHYSEVTLSTDTTTTTTTTTKEMTPPPVAPPPVYSVTDDVITDHVYDDISALNLKQEEVPPPLPMSTGDTEEPVKRVKRAPQRPPPPVPRGSPPIHRKVSNAPPTKSLTLGRSPLTQYEGFNDEIKQLQSPTRNDNPTTKSLTLGHTSSLDGSSTTSNGGKMGGKKNFTSPGIKSKFRTFFRGGSRDDSFTGQHLPDGNSHFFNRGGSLKKAKKNKKGSPQISGPVDVKSKTLPNRSRGKTIDSSMTSTDNTLIDGNYSLITVNISDDEDEDMMMHHVEAIPYQVVDFEQVNMRETKGNQNSTIRQSRSLSHLCDMAMGDDDDIGFTPPPPLSPLDSPTHIYAVVNKKNKEHNETEPAKDDDDEPMDDEPLPTPPPSPIKAHVYAMVSKEENNQVEGVADTPIPDTPSHDKPLRPSISTTPTKAASKYAHLLNLTPPTHEPPAPPTVTLPVKPPRPSMTSSVTSSMTSSIGVTRHKIHDYEDVDFDDPLKFLSSSAPDNHTPDNHTPDDCHSNNFRELKPKNRPAPPPPTSSNRKSKFEENMNTISPGKRILSKRSDGSNHMFLFPSERVISFVEAGDTGSQPSFMVSPSASSSTLSSMTMEANDDDSDVSTDWDASSPEDDDEEEKIPKSKIYYIAHEILTTERTFVKGLRLLHCDFRQHMMSANTAHEKQVVTEETMAMILSNVGNLHMLNSELLKELETRMATWDNDPRLGDIFVKRAPFLKLYSQYISNFDTALKTLEEQQKKNHLFAQVVKEFELEPKCANLTVAAYLLETVQRIPRYKMLLADYIKHLPEDSIDKEDSEKALGIISSVATHVNDTIRQMDNFKKTIEVSKKLIGDVGESLLSPHRKLLKEGELIKSSRKEKQPRMFFLFTDLLIYASAIPPANTTFRVIKRIPLDGMKVQEIDDPELKHGFQIISTCKSFRLDTASLDERDQWLMMFDTAIKSHMKRVKSRQLHRQSIISITEAVDSNAILGSLAPPWLPDSAVSMCQLCGIHFTVTRRRHHCRACGQIYCSECSSYVAPLAYKSNKMCRVCQTCYSTLAEVELDEALSPPTRGPAVKRKKGTLKKISMPSILTEVRARDQNAQVSGYLFYREDKSRQWKRKWFVVYDLVMYEFKRHEDVSAQRTIPLPSYQVLCPVEGINDPLVFALQHSGAGKVLFKTDSTSQLDIWLEVLYKAVKGELDNT